METTEEDNTELQLAFLLSYRTYGHAGPVLVADYEERHSRHVQVLSAVPLSWETPRRQAHCTSGP